VFKKPDSVVSDSLLIVEGKDEVSFLDAYIFRHKGLEKSKVQIIDAGGKYSFRQDLADLKDLPGFDSVRRIAIIRDADLSAEKAFQSVSMFCGANHYRCPIDQATSLQMNLVW